MSSPKDTKPRPKIRPGATKVERDKSIIRDLDDFTSYINGKYVCKKESMKTVINEITKYSAPLTKRNFVRKKDVSISLQINESFQKKCCSIS